MIGDYFVLMSVIGTRGWATVDLTLTPAPRARRETVMRELRDRMIEEGAPRDAQINHFTLIPDTLEPVGHYALLSYLPGDALNCGRYDKSRHAGRAVHGAGRTASGVYAEMHRDAVRECGPILTLGFHIGPEELARTAS